MKWMNEMYLIDLILDCKQVMIYITAGDKKLWKRYMESNSKEPGKV